MFKKPVKLLLLLVASLILVLGGCNKETNKIEDNKGDESMLEQLKKPKAGEEIIVMTTNQGEIKIRLFPQIAPKAVENFKTHAKNGYYNGVTFHRVINEFMIQGGDPDGTGMGGESIWGSAFEDEFDVNFRNIRGALSMANAGANTNGSQFFIVQKTEVDKSIIEQMRQAGEEKGYPKAVVDAYEELGGTFHLDYKHTVFGQVFEGMDIVDKIASVEVDGNDKPINPVIMEKVEVVEYK